MEKNQLYIVGDGGGYHFVIAKSEQGARAIVAGKLVGECEIPVRDIDELNVEQPGPDTDLTFSPGSDPHDGITHTCEEWEKIYRYVEPFYLACTEI